MSKLFILQQSTMKFEIELKPNTGFHFTHTSLGNVVVIGGIFPRAFR